MDNLPKAEKLVTSAPDDDLDQHFKKHTPTRIEDRRGEFLITGRVEKKSKVEYWGVLYDPHVTELSSAQFIMAVNAQAE